MAGNNPGVDLANDNMYTKFGKILSIHSQDIHPGLPVTGNSEVCGNLR